MSVIVKYSDIALGAKEASFITPESAIEGTSVELINTEGAEFKRYDIPTELNSMILDGGSQFLSPVKKNDIGVICDELSDEQGNFPYPLRFNISLDGTFASSGITIKFDAIKTFLQPI